MHNKEPFWLTQLTANERSALLATFSGWMLDGLDVMVYSFVLPSLILIWHISRQQAGLLSTSALLLSAVGGWLAGLAADRFGRVRILQISILWFALFTFLSGFCNNFPELLVARGLQGLGFGGEWAVGSVLVGETIRSRFRGRAVGTVQGGWAIGWALAALFFAFFHAVLRPDLAWRALFWTGILPAFLAFYIRGHVSESNVYRAASETVLSKARFRALDIFSPEIVRVTLLTSTVALGAQGGYYAVTTFLPLYLSTRGLSVMHSSMYLLVIITGSFCGYLTGAWLTDKLGRRSTLILFAACSLAVVLLYSGLPISNRAMLFLGFPLGFFPSGSFSPMGSFFIELFPTQLRGSGQGFAYNLGRGIGAIFPTLVGHFSAHAALGRVIALFAGIAYALMIMAVFALPETQGADLTGSAPSLPPMP